MGNSVSLSCPRAASFSLADQVLEIDEHGADSEESPIATLSQIWLVVLTDSSYDIAFLQLIMSLNRHFRAIGISVIRSRVLREIGRFVPHSARDSFLAILESSGSVIGGSVVQSVLTPAFLLEVHVVKLSFVIYYPIDLNFE